MKILIASNNAHKVLEIQNLLPEGWEVLSFKDFPELSSPEENGITLAENAKIKAEYGFLNTGIPTLADDTGLFVDALEGRPGVHSARYAGPQGVDVDNVNLLLQELSGNENRSAFFITVLAWCIEGKVVYFEGKLSGNMDTQISGKQGFGYDPIFIPQGFEKSLANFSMEEKNSISHRKKALIAWLTAIN